MSPIFVIKKTFIPALTASGREYQNETSAYEHNPTSSQNINSCRKLSDRTRPIIDPMKRSIRK